MATRPAQGPLRFKDALDAQNLKVLPEKFGAKAYDPGPMVTKFASTSGDGKDQIPTDNDMMSATSDG